MHRAPGEIHRGDSHLDLLRFGGIDGCQKVKPAVVAISEYRESPGFLDGEPMMVLELLDG
jgi:hypothetical protein